METKRFTKNDNSFICQNCGLKVKPLSYSSRNHCPRCLYSLHVDNKPGDRLNECGGLMEPIKVETDPKKGYVIIHRCTRCGEIKRNRAANEAKVQPDDIDKLIKLTAIDISDIKNHN
jgi:predicted RNA-binding Zn-ribbon protein involved in translation (DUF1610 family)